MQTTIHYCSHILHVTFSGFKPASVRDPVALTMHFFSTNIIHPEFKIWSGMHSHEI